MSTFHAGAGPRSLAVHGRGAGGPRAGANMSYALAAEQANGADRACGAAAHRQAVRWIYVF